MVTLREARLHKLMSQRALAKAAGVAQKTIVDTEHGRIVPRLTTMRKIATALDIDPMEVDEFRRGIEAQIERGRTGKK